MDKMNRRTFKGFSPESIMKDLNMPKDAVVKEGQELIEEGLITIQYELICPNCGSILAYSSKKQELNGNKECIYCKAKGIDEEDSTIVRFMLVKKGMS